MLSVRLVRLLQSPFILFTILMIFKSSLAWNSIFGEISLWRPMLTELPFIWLIFSFIEWFAAKRRLWYYMSVNLLLTGIFFAAIMYFKYYGVIVTYHALSQMNLAASVKSSMFSLLDPYYLLIFTDIAMLGFLLTRRRHFYFLLSAKRLRRKSIPVLFMLSLAVCLLNVWPNSASMNEIKQAEKMGILNYEAFTVIMNNGPVQVPAMQVTQADINRLKGISAEVWNSPYWKAAKGKNVILIQMESFQNFLIGLSIDGQPVTPNMNKLAREQVYSPSFYQQVGQGNTSDAEFVTNTSMYIPPRGAASGVYSGKELPSLPRLLGEHGYIAVTFHTNEVSFWNREELYRALGFERYYDRSFFGTEDTVAFGASDEVLYSRTAGELAKLDRGDKPFYAHIITMSAHHPFDIPESKYKIKLPARFEGTLAGDYLRAQSYADYALGLFIEDLKKNGVWDNSIIFIYGDHQGLPVYSLDSSDQALMNEIYGREYRSADMINVPLIIAAPGILQHRQLTRAGGQVDILPTAAHLLGISLQGQPHFGQDLLASAPNLLPQRYYLPSGTVLNDHTLFIPGAGYEDGRFYSLRGGEAQEQGALSQSEYQRALKLLQLSDSYIRQLPDLPE
ncbi:LTA synthase family protein [Paenibacillus terreus]|uniref:LTA synthase family protein n=1 Tax=Paenibacillus terreus TaxID=1387834 RepID=A0ABV5B8H9_9BACL